MGVNNDAVVTSPRADQANNAVSTAPCKTYSIETGCLSLEVTGTLVDGCQLSPSFALFILDQIAEEQHGDFLPDEILRSRLLDVILTRGDGWAGSQIETVLKHLTLKHLQTEDSSVRVHGYLERRPTKFATDTSHFCLHALAIHIGIFSYQPAKDTQPARWNQRQNQSSSLPSAEYTITNKIKNNRGANDSSRFAKFVQFLLDEFGGYQGLSKNPVLDVAGGAGSLAFELSIRHGIETIVIDTREVKFRGDEIRHLEFRKQCLERLARVHRSPLVQNLQNRFQTRDFRRLETLLDSSDVLTRKEKRSGGATILKHIEENHLDEAQQSLRDLLHNRECSVMVGLHPDQATDHIVDICLALGIPWAVVPCCVFPNLFTKRQLMSGKTVRTYDDLCEYILQQNPTIQEAILPFRGRNRVFYWHPPED